MNYPTQTRPHWLTLGVKLLLGVALASNCCIGTLLLVNHHATARLETVMGEVLAIRERVDENLRQTIVRLQMEFIALPKLFAADPKQAVMEQVARRFAAPKRQFLSGRESYASLYSRTENRDLANGQLVATIENGGLILSRGIFDAQGKFAAEIERLHLDSSQPERDLEWLRTQIDSARGTADDPAAVAEKIAQLGSLAADKSIEAEKSRTEILGAIDEINHHEQQMHAVSREQRRFSSIIGLAAIVVNVLVLFVLTRIIVERPLRRLTSIVEALSQGRYPEIPWRDRRDQIGVLCAAIGRFREALLTLQQMEARKADDQQRIKTLVQTMTASIHQLNDRAGTMATMAQTLQELAARTKKESDNVAGLASDTAVRTEEVSSSSRQISSAVDAIYRELAAQSAEEVSIQGEIAQARQMLDGLGRSVAEIDTIVGAVHTITDQTKILAINATIEAVKAGEHGRGFAVVAGEVKKLSQDTAHATRDILDKIEAINAICQSFIVIFDQLERGAEQLHRVTATIGLSVDGQRQLSRAIVELTGATGDNTREVSARITEVQAAATGALTLSADTRRYAEEMAVHLGDLLATSVHDLEGTHRSVVAQQATSANPLPMLREEGYRHPQTGGSVTPAQAAVENVADDRTFFSGLRPAPE